VLRAILDVNVLVSATLTPGGTPHRLLERWEEGAFEIVVSASLLGELERVLARPELAARTDSSSIDALVKALRSDAINVDDPPTERVVRRDAADDYLVALARAAGVQAIVTGDRHLLELDDLRPPALEPRAFLALVEKLDG